MDITEQVIAVRRSGLVTKEVGDEVVVYDLDTDKVHLLSPLTAEIWRLAVEQEAVSVQSVLAVVDADDGLVLAAIHELGSAGLLDESETGPLLGFDRRRMLKLIGAGALLGPLVTTILAPPAAATHSGGPCHPVDAGCTEDAQCCSGLCRNNTCVCLANGAACNNHNECCSGVCSFSLLGNTCASS